MCELTQALVSTEPTRRAGRTPETEPAARFTLIEAGVDRTREEFEADVRAGLTRVPKRLSCRFFYDAEGSRLFEEICRLPEYYPFRAEREILSERAQEIVRRCELPTDLVELGSGSAEKTRHLIDALLDAQGSLQYVPIDISRSALEESSRAMLEALPRLSVVAVAGEYREGLRHLPPSHAPRRLFSWLGSNIGNLEREAAVRFIRELRERMNDGDAFLLGVDLRKDASIVQPAYDDAQGVTARFNKNLLERINRQLGGDFDPDSFAHRARYLEEEGRIAVHLVSTRAQTVHVRALDLEVELAEGEAIHTESSIKYSLAEISELAHRTGLSIDATWTDSQERFCEVLLRP